MQLDAHLTGSTLNARFASFLNFVRAYGWEDEPDVTPRDRVNEFFAYVGGFAGGYFETTPDGVRFIRNLTPAESVEISAVSYRPTDIDYRITQNTADWMASRILFDAPTTSEELAGLITEQIAAEAAFYGIELGNIDGLSAKDVLDRYLAGLEPLIDRNTVTMTTEGGERISVVSLYTYQDLYSRWRELANTFAPPINSDVIQWAQDQSFLQLPNSDPDDVEFVIRQYLIEQINLYNPWVSYEIEPYALPLQELSNLYEPLLQAANQHLQQEMTSAVASIPPQEPLLSRPFGLVVREQDWINNLSSQYRDPILHLQYEQERLDRDVYANVGLREAFRMNYETPPPDVSLLLFVASVLFDFVDYGLTVPEIIEDVSERNYSDAIVKTALLVLPGFNGRMYAGKSGDVIGVPSSSLFDRYDPQVPGRPDPAWSIDTSTFARPPARLTAHGERRDYLQFWRQWQELDRQLGRETLSPTNLSRIQDNRSPVVDDQWVQYFPEHAPYMLQRLDHHHVAYGPYAVPLPTELHIGSGNRRIFHP